MKYFFKSFGISLLAAIVVFLSEAVFLMLFTSGDEDNNTFYFIVVMGILLLFVPYIYARWHMPYLNALCMRDMVAAYAGILASTALLVFGDWIHLVMLSIAAHGLSW